MGSMGVGTGVGELQGQSSLQGQGNFQIFHPPAAQLPNTNQKPFLYHKVSPFFSPVIIYHLHFVSYRQQITKQKEV